MCRGTPYYKSMLNEQLQPGKQKKIFLVIHGHFYQPPRENPWTQTIPLQESAKPFHDWNERITVECYKPNTRSRALDGQEKILYLVNNFAHLNFNIGPTLFSWIEKYYPDTYPRILEADRKSCAANQGHGNAIAQVYNHMILPLATDRDKLTQIIWGTREFQHRFGRAPESIWLAETAINQATVKCVIDQGLKYVILSPTQAQKIRKIGAESWTDVSQNGIDITQPYRIFLKSASEKYLDVFFYDASVSTDISFNHLLRDADTFAHRIYEASAKSSAPNVLIQVATDGEVYGHHEPFGDMCLAAAIISKFPALYMEMTNYGRYLEMYPPTMEVELKPGSENDEGTAWSCAHGVGRWDRDCGCHIGHTPGWNQQWRTPLRKGFDVLRDALADIFEQLGGAFLRDPWEARNDYIACLLDPAEHTVNTFLDKHAQRPLSPAEQSLVLRLLEAQKYALFTYTSCAWFFDDISGLEVTQNMRYAARALQLVEGLETGNRTLDTGNSQPVTRNLEALMLDEFEQAKSNLLQIGTGKDIYLNSIKPDVYTPERAVNQFLLENLITGQWSDRPGSDGKNPEHVECPAQERLWNDARQIHIYTLACPEYFPPNDEHQKATPCPTTHSGVLLVKETLTRQEWLMLFTAFLYQQVHPVSYLKRLKDDAELSQFKSAVSRLTSQDPNPAEKSSSELVSFLEDSGFTPYSLTDVYADDRERLFYTMIQDHVDRTENHIRNIYEDSLELLAYLTIMNFQVPAKLRAAVEFSLSHQLLIEIEKLYTPDRGLHSPALLSAELEKILQLSQIHHLKLDTTLLQNRLNEAITKYLAHLSWHVLACEEEGTDDTDMQDWNHFLTLLQETFKLIEKAEKLGVVLERAEIQNVTYGILEKMIPHYLATFEAALNTTDQPESSSTNQQVFFRFFKEYKFIHECLKLAKRLNFNVERYRELLISAELALSENEVSVPSRCSG